MRKIILGLFVLFPLLVSCSEDEDKVIQTDLYTEASELFDITSSWSESVYFALIPYQEYLSNDSLSLPGKPIISVDSAFSVVTLTFHPDSIVNQSGKYKRSGELNLTYLGDSSMNYGVIMTYSNYTFEGNSILGTRDFRESDSVTFTENLSELKHITPKNLTTVFLGNFTHTKHYSNDSMISFTTLGELSGQNPAGRDFSILLTEAQESIIQCIKQNEILPISGAESWTVSRGGKSSVTYKMNYTALDSCNVEAYAMLPDGKRLLLNPE